MSVPACTLKDRLEDHFLVYPTHPIFLRDCLMKMSDTCGREIRHH